MKKTLLIAAFVSAVSSLSYQIGYSKGTTTTKLLETKHAAELKECIDERDMALGMYSMCFEACDTAINGKRE